ncbi:MAG: NUDIX hydrolase [Betaproteobacteria bacterium]
MFHGNVHRISCFIVSHNEESWTPKKSNTMPIGPMPLCRVEITAQSLVDGRLNVFLIRRQEAPYKGSWALPGGVLRVDLDANLDAAAKRVAAERLGIAPPNLRQLAAVGARGRGPRGEEAWALSVVYRALIPASTLSFTPDKRAAEVRWVAVDELPTKIAFEHSALIELAARQTRADIASLTFPAGFIPERFTLGALQRLCEEVLGTRLDKSSFRRKLRDRELVEPIAGAQQRGDPHRPAAIYRLSSDRPIGATPRRLEKEPRV